MADLSPGSEGLTPLNPLPVTRSWNWSTWANGDLPHIWPDIRVRHTTMLARYLEHGELFWTPIKRQGPFPLLETDVASSKMAGGSGNGPCPLMGAQKFLYTTMTCWYTVIVIFYFCRAWASVWHITYLRPVCWPEILESCQKLSTIFNHACFQALIESVNNASYRFYTTAIYKNRIFENYWTVFYDINIESSTTIMSYLFGKLWRLKENLDWKQQDTINKSTVIESMHRKTIYGLLKRSKRNFGFQNQNVETKYHW